MEVRFLHWHPLVHKFFFRFRIQGGLSSKQKRLQRQRRTRSGHMQRSSNSPRRHPNQESRETETVINILNIALSPKCIIVLSKGLTFAPTYSANETKVNLFCFYRNVHLKTWYYNNHYAMDNIVKSFKTKSTFFLGVLIRNSIRISIKLI